jgi:hypothetical protein
LTPHNYILSAFYLTISFSSLENHIDITKTHSTMPSLTLAKGAALLVALLPAAQAQLFTVNCAPLTIQRGDPIVSPGQVSAHVHAVVGGSNFQLRLSNDEARAARATTCDKVLDNSNYWQPQLYHQRRDGSFEIVEMEGAVSTRFSSICV